MKCPGQDSRLWGPDAIYESKCPECGGPIEFFKDETSRRCRKCSHKVLNPKMDFGCAAYCKYASQCLGGDIPPELLAKRSDLLKDRVAAEVKKTLGRDFRRIARTLKLVDYTGKIFGGENVDPAVPTLAAYLLALFRPLQEDPRGLAVVILTRTGTPDEVSRDVLAILDSIENEENPDSPEGRCLSDARAIADIEDALAEGLAKPEEVARMVGVRILTKSGRELAAQVLPHLARA